MKSTGPRSVEGKAVSRFNALKHGMDAASVVLPGENPADYEAMVASYDEELQPETPTERFHVDTMIQSNWQKQRLQRLEAELIRTLLADTPGGSLLAVMLSDSPGAKLLARTQRQIAAHERTWFRAHREYLQLSIDADKQQQEAYARFVDSLAPVDQPSPELASFPQESDGPTFRTPAAPQSVASSREPSCA
jgi:hypothetical protein